jgi:drug/metabolite transporter (DMT)-like permease
MNPTQRRGVLLLVIAAVGYAFLPIMIKWAYDAGMQPIDVLTWRFVVATPCIWLLLFATGNARLDGRLPRLPLLGMGVMFATVAMFAFFALQRIPASIFSVLLYCYPAFVALLSLFLGERLSGRGWVALGLTLVGIILTVPNLSSDLTRGDPFGMLLALLNGAFYSVYIVWSNRLLRGQTALAQASALSITGSLLAMLVVALFNGIHPPANPQAWITIIAMSIIATVIPIFAFYAGLHKLGAPQAAILSTLEPVIVLVLSFVLLGETMLPIQLVGGALILSSAILLQVGRRDPIAEAPSIAPVSELP